MAIKTFKQFRESAAEQTELELYVENTSEIYRKYIVPAVDALRKKFKKGEKLDSKKAAKLFKRAVDEGAKLYNKEIGPKNFSASDKNAVALSIAQGYVTEVELGN